MKVRYIVEGHIDISNLDASNEKEALKLENQYCKEDPGYLTEAIELSLEDRDVFIKVEKVKE